MDLISELEDIKAELASDIQNLKKKLKNRFSKLQQEISDVNTNNSKKEKEGK